MINIDHFKKKAAKGPRQNHGRSPGPVYVINKKRRFLII